MKRVDPSLYTKEYYLTEATGYELFKKSFGMVLEPRLERIVKKIPLKKGMKVLDIGCGRGELVFWSVKEGASEVIGIDYSKDAIKLAKRAKRHWTNKIQNKVDFRVMDAKNLKFKNDSFEAVLLTEVLEHLYPQEQELILKKIFKILKVNGFIFIHTAPSKWFNDFTYRFWCYPISSLLVSVNNLLTRNNYPNISLPSQNRTKYHKIMHVNEPDYFSLKNLFKKTGFSGRILSTNVTIAKPIYSWKDTLFNLLVYLDPISYYPPFNIVWGNDYYAVLRKRK